MLENNKNLKDVEIDSVRDTFSESPKMDQPISELRMSYTKTNKLISALYMVTDIIDKDEPMRNKLRTLGAGIISDIHSKPSNACSKIYEIMSFLEVAFAISIISEMNCSILRKEFTVLNQSILDATDKAEILNRQVNLSEIFKDHLSAAPGLTLSHNVHKSIGHSIGHTQLHKGQIRTRIGVQKGSTLLKALSEKTNFLFNMESNRLTVMPPEAVNQFDELRQKRRDDILNLVKIIGGTATIKDIRDKVRTAPDQAGLLVSCSEKTLQRELMSMIKDDVLNKTGEKRWSRYFLK